MKKDLLSISDLSKREFLSLLKKAQHLKKYPKKYHHALYEKTLMTYFQQPSLRTEVSFDVAMFQMGGEIIDYHAETSPWAKGKEALEDVAKVISRYCDIIMIRMPNHEDLVKFAKNASIPVINGLTSLEHPCQIVGDFLTILEKKKKLTNLKLAYVGDANNNVTHSLMLACALFGLDMSISCPALEEFLPQPSLVKQAKTIAQKTGVNITITANPREAAQNSDILYTDSFMSYHIPKSQEKRRVKLLKPFQVNQELIKYAKKNAIFMHCLPAKRGYEVTADVIDGKQSVVFDQAENRLHAQKAIILHLMHK
ncbi:ornithine carbamoyltransferase [Candidatus Woesearchaeota archaeon]|nr:ornithine carbamoyltransferase [Candidatus Woesearchaeota archaeon]